MTDHTEIKNWMDRHGLKPDEAASALGISRAQAYRHLAGRPLPTRTARLAALYDRDPAALSDVAGVKTHSELWKGVAEQINAEVDSHWLGSDMAGWEVCPPISPRRPARGCGKFRQSGPGRYTPAKKSLTAASDCRIMRMSESDRRFRRVHTGERTWQTAT